MREYLFRGQRVDTKEWVYGDLIHNDNTHFPMTLIGSITMSKNKYTNELELDGDCLYEVIPETVGQYTDLTDKNGKKIFEGDIFKFNDEVWESYYTSCGTEYDSWEVENYGVVGFVEDLAKYDFVKYKFNENSVEADLHENHDIEFSEFVRELEVIGNIHDNPELLEGDK